jgi:hypothetical protein
MHCVEQSQTYDVAEPPGDGGLAVAGSTAMAINSVSAAGSVSASSRSVDRTMWKSGPGTVSPLRRSRERLAGAATTDDVLLIANRLRPATRAGAVRCRTDPAQACRPPGPAPVP